MVFDLFNTFGWDFGEEGIHLSPDDEMAYMAIEDILEIIKKNKKADITDHLSVLSSYFGYDLPKGKKVYIEVKDE